MWKRVVREAAWAVMAVFCGDRDTSDTCETVIMGYRDDITHLLLFVLRESRAGVFRMFSRVWGSHCAGGRVLVGLDRHA